MNAPARPEQVVVLAGGLATRLGALSRHTPKILQPVAGRTFLDVMLEPLLAQDFRRFHFCVGHLGEQVAAHLREHYADLPVSVHHDPVPRGTGGALRASRRRLAEHFLLLLGDTYLPLDYGRLLECRRPGSATLAATGADCGVRPNVALDGDLVVRYDKANGVPGGLVDCGAAVMDRASLDLLDGLDDPVDLAELHQRLITRGALHALPVDVPFWDIGTPEGYTRFTSLVDASGVAPC